MTTAVDRSETARDWPIVVALMVLTALCALAAGPIGLLAGLASAVAWYALGVPYAIAVGHIVLAPVAVGGTDPMTVLLVELGYLAVVIAPVVDVREPRRTGAVAVTSAAGFVGVGWVAAHRLSLWLAAVVVCLAVGLVAYGLHRYELVRLGLVSDDRSTDSTVTPSDHS
ncbi:hypothetical protein RBH26_19375 [Natronolimnohabitans sp. A-GB9]|uniref:hypothetical protein n=1 Tax=Natronolimnohabitans sp. A-GB9 TaxID=3069757 RepID=UPI0027B6AF6A|nr:hypothetical protein [Natronolimnohabitans sp. A-GB9]MDQ2052623.1 hypothetical protein [Natronolimnohabitans sp. A-GB9]